MLSYRFPCFIFLLTVSILWPVKAAQKDFTLDDSNSLVTYDPPDAWNSNGNCPNGKCYAQPDASRIAMRTWHESTFRAGPGANAYPNTPLSVTARFHGNSVKVYAVIPQSLGAVELPRTASLKFFMDGVPVQEFSHPAVPDYLYGFLVYDSHSLPLGSHELRITNGQVDGEESLFILDQIIYSDIVNEPPNTPVTTTPPPSAERPAEFQNPTPSVSVIDHTVTEQLSNPNPTHSFIQTTPPSPGQTTRFDTPSSSSTSSPAPTTPSPLPSSPNTPDNEDTLRSHHPPIGTIVGAALGSLAGIVTVLLIVGYCRRRRRRYPKATNKFLSPFEVDTGGVRPHVSAGWVIASDTKRDILTIPPPAYRS